MIVKYGDSEDSESRDALISEILPKETFVKRIIEPEIENCLFNALSECVRGELELLRIYPKKVGEEPVEEKAKTFDPTNNSTCFMGKAFKSNNKLVDVELVRYRKAVGTVPHWVWGNSTLLEIWGGDHFEDYQEMVIGAFEYAFRLREDCPEIVFHTNPLFKNEKSKEFKLSESQREEKEFLDDLFARALVYGVKDVKQARRDMKRGRR